MGIRTEALGITVPILSAPMGFVAGGKLAATERQQAGSGNRRWLWRCPPA
jgi:NAD(P)H-dependent flavin oxidoreductase YrpB (nitropropane dioxygenase family)